MKVAINRCWGVFGLSEKAYKELGFKWDGYGYADNEDFEIVSDDNLAYRTDKRLINVIEKLGNKASGKMSNVIIVEIPDGIEFEIDDYDGQESVHEKHRSW